jgi:cytochrome c
VSRDVLVRNGHAGLAGQGGRMERGRRRRPGVARPWRWSIDAATGHSLAVWVAATVAMLAASAPSLGATPAQTGRQLAADKGCFNCHGEPPKRDAPRFAELAAGYAGVRGDDAALARLADRLRRGSIFGHVDAHERLSADEAARLVRWIADGAGAP